MLGALTTAVAAEFSEHCAQTVCELYGWMSYRKLLRGLTVGVAIQNGVRSELSSK